VVDVAAVAAVALQPYLGLEEGGLTTKLAGRKDACSQVGVLLKGGNVLFARLAKFLLPVRQ
jgi:hypothetical protein